MKIDDRIVKRLEELISLGEQVLRTRRDPPRGAIGFDASVDTELSQQWATQSQNILSRVFGNDSPHYINFTKETKKITFGPARRMQGILKAALDDYSHGYLFDLKRLITGDVFSNMLEQSRHLLTNGYFQAAMVLAGAVLEDTMRSLCGQHAVALSEKPKLDKMNSDLAKAGAYSKLIQKRITTIADIRNKAAHGKWAEFSADDVTDALGWIERFVEDNCA